MDLGLQNKKVFISGSTRGIGLATAEVFLEEGATVIINGRNREVLEKQVSRLAGIYLDRVRGVSSDILTEAGRATVYEYFRSTDSLLDIFVGNLGSGKPENANSLNPEELTRFYDINVVANIGLLDQLHHLLKKSGSGTVVLLSSAVAKETASAPCGYAAAKSAVVTMTKYLARMWAKDSIRVNCVLPGNVYFQGGRWEELSKADGGGVASYIKDTVPMGRFGSPREIADAIVYLSSNRASFITGATLSVDGGQLRAI